MRVLGIDPGIETTGFAVIENKQILDFGVILTDKKTPFATRLAEISKELSEIIKKYSPDKMAIEKLIFMKNISSGIAVSHARGVMILEAEKAGLLIEEIQPTEVKIRITGYGNAPKIQVQNMVVKVFGLSEIPRPDDSADALAVAYASSS
jgi:crossover junction endodeoxyribonuclease RuvC